MAEDEKKLSEETRAATGPLVFISHDSRDSELAEAFSKLLSSVSAGVLKTFRSSDRKGSQGIEYGVEWYPELMARLAASSDIVCLLTERSVGRPWILYEAGVAKGKLNCPVYGIALGIPLGTANSGPFAQFQNCDDDDESLTKLVTQLIKRVPGSEPDHDAILMQVKMFKERVLATLQKLGTHRQQPARTPAAPDADSSVAKLFEEVKVMFQDLPARIERRVIDRPSRMGGFGRISPMALYDMARAFSRGPDDPVALLVVASFLRDELPWLYDMTSEFYGLCRHGKIREIEEGAERLHQALEMVIRGPLGEDLGPNVRELRFLHDVIERARREAMAVVREAKAKRASEGHQ